MALLDPSAVPEDFLEFARKCVNDPVWRNTVRIKFRERTLAPGMEKMIVEYAVGKPKEHIEHTIVDETDIHNASKDQLLARLAELQKAVLEIEEEEDPTASVH